MIASYLYLSVIFECGECGEQSKLKLLKSLGGWLPFIFENGGLHIYMHVLSLSKLQKQNWNCWKVSQFETSLDNMSARLCPRLNSTCKFEGRRRRGRSKEGRGTFAFVGSDISSWIPFNYFWIALKWENLESPFIMRLSEIFLCFKVDVLFRNLKKKKIFYFITMICKRFWCYL